MYQRLKFYTLDERYFHYLVQFDNKIMAIDDEKSHRPFVEVLLSIDGIDYYAPLTSPKLKHQSMKNQYRWCQNHSESIIKKAVKLYHMMEQHPPELLQKRCCDFKLLEEKCKLYLEPL